MSKAKRERQRADLPIPPRGPNVERQADRMLFTFDVDCGELISGHRFIARGICDQGMGDWHELGADVPTFSLEYELVPGVPGVEDERFLSYLVGIEYQCDVPLPWTPNDGGAMAPFKGGVSTHGSRGDWPFPRSARILRFVLTGVDGSTGLSRGEPDGVLVVDLQDETATWKPRR